MKPCLTRDRWIGWLNSNVPATEVLRHFPKTSFPVTRVYPPPSEPREQAERAL